MRSKYTAQEEQQLVDAYTQAESDEERLEVIEEYADRLDKTKQSIVAKLSKLKIYQPKRRISKVTGDTPETKEQIVKKIAAICGGSDTIYYGLEKGPKLALVQILSKLKK